MIGSRMIQPREAVSSEGRRGIWLGLRWNLRCSTAACLAVGLLLVVVAAIVLAIVQAIATNVLGHSPKEPQQVVPCVRGIGLAVLAPIVIVAAPLGEELFFRGFLYQGLRRRFSIWP